VAGAGYVLPATWPVDPARVRAMRGGWCRAVPPLTVIRGAAGPGVRARRGHKMSADRCTEKRRPRRRVAAQRPRTSPAMGRS
jgi:hypothetical protein